MISSALHSKNKNHPQPLTAHSLHLPPPFIGVTRKRREALPPAGRSPGSRKALGGGRPECQRPRLWRREAGGAGRPGGPRHLRFWPQGLGLARVSPRASARRSQAGSDKHVERVDPCLCCRYYYVLNMFLLTFRDKGRERAPEIETSMRETVDRPPPARPPMGIEPEPGNRTLTSRFRGRHSSPEHPGWG